jgi:hypothetical protein
LLYKGAEASHTRTQAYPWLERCSPKLSTPEFHRELQKKGAVAKGQEQKDDCVEDRAHCVT